MYRYFCTALVIIDVNAFANNNVSGNVLRGLNCYCHNKNTSSVFSLFEFELKKVANHFKNSTKNVNAINIA